MKDDNEKAIELQLGYMSNKQLADWFGIKVASFRAHKDKKLEILKDFADYEMAYGGVKILKIYMPVYEKQSSRNYQIVRDAFEEEWDKSGIDSCANVSDKIMLKHYGELTLTPNSTYIYTLKTRDELYGKPFVNLGKNGSCIYLWCKVELSEDNVYVYTPFTEEEQAIKKQLMKKYFSTDVEKEVLVAEMVDNGEISKSEAYDLLREMKNLNSAGFMAFKTELEDKIGSKITKATLLQREEPLTLREGNFELKA